MVVLVVLAHPDKASFNAAIAEAAIEELREQGHDVIFHDLYEERFDPLLFDDEFSKNAELPSVVERHCADIVRAEGIVIIHPNWWGQPPAILKGWVDRVIRPGVAYRFDEGDSGQGVPVGLLSAHTAVVLNTSNTNPDRESHVFGDPLELIWKNCIFDLCGVRRFYRKMFRIIVTSTLEDRLQWLQETRQIIRDHFPSSR